VLPVREENNEALFTICFFTYFLCSVYNEAFSISSISQESGGKGADVLRKHVRHAS